LQHTKNLPLRSGSERPDDHSATSAQNGATFSAERKADLSLDKAESHP
jgi:hypothetical protein